MEGGKGGHPEWGRVGAPAFTSTPFQIREEHDRWQQGPEADQRTLVKS